LPTRFTLVLGDITTQQVDAIVNAANPTLLGGGGVDGAIHAAAGPELLEECRGLHGCQTGEAKITRGYLLPAKYVIHTVGPRYGQEQGREAELLRSCYARCLEVAAERGVQTIAFPAISAGVYGYPLSEAAAIAVQAVCSWVHAFDCFTEIRFLVYSSRAKRMYIEAMQHYCHTMPEDDKIIWSV